MKVVAVTVFLVGVSLLTGGSLHSPAVGRPVSGWTGGLAICTDGPESSKKAQAKCKDKIYEAYFPDTNTYTQSNCPNAPDAQIDTVMKETTKTSKRSADGSDEKTCGGQVSQRSCVGTGEWTAWTPTGVDCKLKYKEAKDKKDEECTPLIVMP